jgi:hypothetical protein
MLVHSYIRMPQPDRNPAGKVQLDRDHEAGTRPTGFSYVYMYLPVPR